MKEKQKLGFGTAAIGRPQYINIKTGIPRKFNKVKFREHGMNMLDLAYEKGIRYFDTSPGYGMAEDILIDWLKTKNDETIELATKWGYSYVANFDPNATLHEVKDHSLSQLISQWEDSIKLLPALTTYQIHSATFDTGVLENDAVLNKLFELQQEHDLTIGLTTTGDNQLEVLKRAIDVEVKGVQLFNMFQVTYNILDQSLHDISKQLIESGKRIVVKEALANGRLLRNDAYPNYSNIYMILDKLAAKYSVGVDAIALSFCMQTVDPYLVLSGALEKEQLLSNLKVNTFQLNKEEIILLQSLAVQPELYWKERKKLIWQ